MTATSIAGQSCISRDDFVAPGVDDDGVFGAGRADARAPRQSHVGLENQAAVGPQEDLAWGIADHAALVVERPFVGMVELFVDPLGAAEDFGDDFTGAGEEDAGRVDHRGQGMMLSKFGVDRTERDRAGHRRTQPMAAAGDGDRGSFADRETP